MNNHIKYRIFGIILIIIICIGLTFKYLQNDTFYIIKLGDFIVHKGLDNIDHYSWISGLSYTYPHWLYDVFIYYVYYYFGYFGIYVSVIVCYIFLILVVFYVCLKILKNDLISLIVAVICAFRLSAFAVARAQIISLPMFVLEVYFINRLLRNGNNKYIIYLCVLSLLIANVHATAWLMYFVLFLPFIGEYVIYRIINNKSVRRIYRLDKYKDFRVTIGNISNIKKVFIAFGLCFLMGIISPSRICYTYVFRIMIGNSQNVLLEHLPLTVIEEPFFMVSLLLFFVALIFTNVKIKLRELFLIGGLVLMSLMSVRHLSFFFTIGVICMVVVIYRALLSIGDNTFEVLGNIIINNRLFLLLILLVVVLVSCNQFYRHNKEKYVLKNRYPVDAVRYIKENLDYKNIRLYNEYNYGSYLLFNDIPVFIDSRCDLYLKEFNGMKYSIFDDMEDIEFKYEKKFKMYDVSHVILNKENPFYLILINNNNYNTIYQDKNFILFERIG